MRLGVLWALFIASGKMFIRNRAAVFFSLFLPLIIMLIFGVLNFEGSAEIELGIVDEADNEASAALVEELGTYDYLVLSPGEREAELDRARGGRPRLRARDSGGLGRAGAGRGNGARCVRRHRGSGTGTGFPGPAPAGGRPGAVRTGRRWRSCGARAAGDLRVGRDPRPRLHRLPGPGHRGHDDHAARALRRRLRLRPAQADRRAAPPLRDANLAELLPLGTGPVAPHHRPRAGRASSSASASGSGSR